MDLRNEFIKGADISSLLEVEAAGGRFYDQATGNRQQGTGERIASASHRTGLAMTESKQVPPQGRPLAARPRQQPARPRICSASCAATA